MSGCTKHGHSYGCSACESERADERLAALRVDLAAAQARESELRPLVAAYRSLIFSDYEGQAGLPAPWDERVNAIDAALSRAPGSREALRAMLTSDAAVEAAAEVEHVQWVAWASNLMEREPSLSPERVERWRGLLGEYAGLSDEMKEFDRKWARASLRAIVARLLGEEGGER